MDGGAVCVSEIRQGAVYAAGAAVDETYPSAYNNLEGTPESPARRWQNVAKALLTLSGELRTKTYGEEYQNYGKASEERGR